MGVIAGAEEGDRLRVVALIEIFAAVERDGHESAINVEAAHQPRHEREDTDERHRQQTPQGLPPIKPKQKPQRRQGQHQRQQGPRQCRHAQRKPAGQGNPNRHAVKVRAFAKPNHQPKEEVQEQDPQGRIAKGQVLEDEVGIKCEKQRGQQACPFT